MADPAVRAKMKRAWQPPPEFADLFATLKRKVGRTEAKRLVQSEIARAARKAPPAPHPE